VARKTQTKLHLFQRELDISAEIQKHILPPDNMQLKGYTISASMIPAREIGGDFYDYFDIDAHRVGIVIGDVSGKGIPAAIFMAVTRALTKATAMQGWSAAECLGHVNRVLSEDNPTAMFVTMFYGVLNKKNNSLEYCLAGHDSPYLIDGNGEVKALERTANMAMGFDADIQYQSKSVHLKRGDKLFFFTDGISEAENRNCELFGRERLASSLLSLQTKSSDQLVSGVLKKIRSFTLGTEQSDDITAMAVTI
jgi:serine phosphatase RsbU (regulator of sigma subunit)